MLTAINNNIYCEVKDIQGINPATLKSKLARARNNAQAKEWHNIANPNFNGLNSRRLIAINYLPLDVKNQVLKKFNLSLKELESGLIEEAKKEDGDVIKIANTAVANVVQITETFVLENITEYIDKHWAHYSSYYLQLGIETKNILRYARTCALVQKIWNSTENVIQTLDNKEYKRLRRTLVMNLANAMSIQNLNVVIPKSEYRLTEWIDNIMKAFYLPEKNVFDLVEVKNLNNKNRQKFTAEQKEIANGLRIKSNSLPISHIYNKLLNIAQEKKWWFYSQEFKPIDVSTLQNHFSDTDNLLAIQREGNVAYINKYRPTITRSLPININALWGIDGSPLDLLISNGEKASQIMNSVRVYDYASNRLIGLDIYSGKGEKGHNAIAAILEAIRYTGYKPKALQFDGGPASAEIEIWCKANNVIPMPANKGLARAKLIENLIHHFNQITRNHNAWSGQNRTAQGRNSQVSEQGYKDAQKNADTFNRTAYWVLNDAREQWNSRIIQTLERKPCGKSPNQLWAEKKSATPLLSAIDLALVAGIQHRIKLKIEGLTIQANNYTYTYYPNILTPNGFNKGLEIFSKTPLFHHPESGKLSLYMLQAGDKEAYIFNKDIDKGGKYLDTWILKPTVSMAASQEGDSELLAKMLSFQKEIKKLAINLVQEAKNTQQLENNNKDQPTIIITKYDKETLQEEEMLVNTSTGEVIEKEPTKIYFHPITGMEINQENN